MGKSKVNYPSDFIRKRRIEIGLEPCEIAQRIGMRFDTYRQIECRGQLPLEHLASIAEALGIQEEELKAEKVAAIAEAILGIPRNETHGFINKFFTKQA